MVLLIAVAPLAATAQSLDDIVYPTSTNIRFDGTVGPGVARQLQPEIIPTCPTCPNFFLVYPIRQRDGTLSGNQKNLFHSFSVFDVSAGSNVFFFGDPSIQNVIARVTGGSPTRINGFVASLVDSEVPIIGNAPNQLPNFVANDVNLYFLNPDGIFFGPRSTILVRGALRLATADTLHFKDGFDFLTADGENRLSALALLDVTEPESFGFLRADAAPIGFAGNQALNAQRAVAFATRMTIASGGIWVTDGAVIGTGRGDLRLASIGSAGQLLLADADFADSARSFSDLGTVEVSGHGTNRVFGVVSDFPSTLCSNCWPLARRFGFLNRSGGISIFGGQVTVSDGGVIDARRDAQFFLAPRGGGALEIEADDLTLENRAILFAGSPPQHSAAPSSVGSIDLRVNTLSVRSGSKIFAGDRQYAEGTAALIRINGGTITIRARDSVLVEGDLADFSAMEQSSISSGSLRGKAGSVIIEGRDEAEAGPEVTLRGNAGIFSNVIFSADSAESDAIIDLKVKNLLMEGGASISSNTLGDASAADIKIHADESITLRGTLQQRAFYQASQENLVSCLSGGDCKGILLRREEIEERVQALTDCFTGGGCDDLNQPETVIAGLSFGGGGASADILLEAGESINVTEGAQIISATIGDGNGGGIRLVAKNIGVTESGLIWTDSLAQAAGNAGDIFLLGEESVNIVNGAVSANTTGSGDGGNVLIRAPDVAVEQGGIVTTSTTSSGSGGSVTVIAPNSLVVRGSDPRPSVIASGSVGRLGVDNPPGTVVGDAGAIGIVSSNVEVDGGLILASSDALGGNAGAITIADVETVLDATDSLSEAERLLAREGGEGVVLEQLFIGGDGQISSSSEGLGDAGSVTIGSAAAPAERIVLSNGSIRTSATVAGGGEISIFVSGSLELERGSAITASVAAGNGGKIEIRSPGYTVLRDASSIVAEAADQPGTGGEIRIDTGLFFQSPDSKVSADAPTFSGTVEITSPEVDVESEVTPLETAFLDASAHLQPVCAARARRGEAGSFTIARKRAQHTSPEGLLLFGDELAGLQLAASDDELPPVSAAGRKPDSLSVAMSSSVLRGGQIEEEVTTPAQFSSEASLLADLERAETAGDNRKISLILGSLGGAYLALGELEPAKEHLERAGTLARQAGENGLAARQLHALGNLHIIRKDYGSAFAAYSQSTALAREAKDPASVARALAGAGRALLEDGGVERSADVLKQATAVVSTLPETHQKAAIGIHLAKSYERLAALPSAKREAQLLEAHAALVGAGEAANEIGAELLLSYALGNLAALYQAENRYEEALFLTRQAIRAAEQAGVPESLYRWYWREGQLLWSLGQAAEAVASYRRAVEILEETRPETRTKYGAADLHFRRTIAPVYLDLVQALLESSDRMPQRADATRLLLETRSTMERFRAAELRDYFRDECVAEIEAKQTSLDGISADTAVIYPIIFPDRLELLVSLPSGLQRHVVPVTSAELGRAIAGFGKGIRSARSFDYRPHAEKLYDWLVRPYESELEQEKVKTLVFVPDGPLRTIPMAALHDGSDYLVRRYALAVTPGLTLTDPRRFDSSAAKLLLAGVSEPVQGYPAIPNVARELEAIQAIYGGEILLDESFETAQFEAELASGEYSVVHIASHAVFTGDPDTSFLLTHDGKLAMDAISKMVAPTQFQRQPLELLTLSACETAVGDERAALGLAGVAIRAGARSALGSLWRIQDESTYRLLVRFYSELKIPNTSKAEALRNAQLALLESRAFAHPYFWSAFLLISNWL